MFWMQQKLLNKQSSQSRLNGSLGNAKAMYRGFTLVELLVVIAIIGGFGWTCGSRAGGTCESRPVGGWKGSASLWRDTLRLIRGSETTLMGTDAWQTPALLNVEALCLHIIICRSTSNFARFDQKTGECSDPVFRSMCSLSRLCDPVMSPTWGHM
jgi:prepilin-type N-terminal cleavage/methylation domain-containing protein